MKNVDQENKVKNKKKKQKKNIMQNSPSQCLLVVCYVTGSLLHLCEH